MKVAALMIIQLLILGYIVHYIAIRGTDGAQEGK